MRSTCREVEFICKNKDCSRPEFIRKNWVWSDRDKNPDCIYCGQELDVMVFKIKNSAPAQMKFAGKSAAEKREIMKKRSSDHFHKNIKESWLEKNRR